MNIDSTLNNELIDIDMMSTATYTALGNRDILSYEEEKQFHLLLLF